MDVLFIDYFNNIVNILFSFLFSGQIRNCRPYEKAWYVQICHIFLSGVTVFRIQVVSNFGESISSEIHALASKSPPASRPAISHVRVHFFRPNTIIAKMEDYSQSTPYLCPWNMTSLVKLKKMAVEIRNFNQQASLVKYCLVFPQRHLWFNIWPQFHAIVLLCETDVSNSQLARAGCMQKSHLSIWGRRPVRRRAISVAMTKNSRIDGLPNFLTLKNVRNKHVQTKFIVEGTGYESRRA